MRWRELATDQTTMASKIPDGDKFFADGAPQIALRGAMMRFAVRRTKNGIWAKMNHLDPARIPDLIFDFFGTVFDDCDSIE